MTFDTEPPAELTSHPFADLIPGMDDEDYNALVEDIRKRGLVEPIVLYEGQILDGRHRHRACIELGVVPLFIEYTGEDPLGFVVARNISRRHLNASQKSLMAIVIAAEYAELAKANIVEGGRVSQHRQTLDSDPIDAVKMAAKTMGVSHGYVSNAKRLVAVADPALVQEVRSGTKSLPAALRIVQGEVNKPKVTPKRKRVPFGTTFRRAVLECTKNVKKLDKLTEDDRFGSHRESLQFSPVRDLERVRDDLNAVINRLSGEAL